MGHHLYDENKRLRNENEALLAQLNERRAREVPDTDVVAEAVIAFFKGQAFFDILPGPNVEGSFMVFFRNPDQTT